MQLSSKQFTAYSAILLSGILLNGTLQSMNSDSAPVRHVPEVFKIFEQPTAQRSLHFLPWRTGNARTFERPITQRPVIRPTQEAAEENLCCICLEDLKQKETITTCNGQHVFHKQCLMHSLKHKLECPLDRQKLVPEEVFKPTFWQERLYDATLFGEGTLYGAAGRLNRQQNQYLSFSLSLFTTHILPLIISRIDFAFYPQSQDTLAQIRRRVTCDVLESYLAAVYGQTNLSYFIRPFVRDCIYLSRQQVFNATPGIDYQFMRSTDTKTKKRYALLAAGFIAGLYVGGYIDNQLEQFVATYLP